MRIDPNMYNKKGYLFEGEYSIRISYWFEKIHKFIFTGKPPYNVELAYKLRKVILWFFRKHNLIK